MKKALLLFLLLFIITSCSKDYLFKKHQVAISNELKAIANADQGVRHFNSMVLLKYKIRNLNTICDSLYMAGSIDLISTYDFSKVPSEMEQASKLPDKLYNAFDEDNEEGRKLMKYVDTINRQRLYKIIKKYGYPSFYNRKWIDTVNVRTGITFVLTHFNYDTPKEKKFLKLMIKEYLAGRVEEGEMKNLLWRVSDSKESLSEYKMNIEDWKKKVGL